MSHTKGLLAVNHDRIESKDEHGWANDGWIIAQCMGPDAVANTRRLVACWNACDGLPQDALDGGWTAAGISQYATRLEGERDALKKELREDFEKWASESYDVCQAVEKSHARDGWNARQPEIDAWMKDSVRLSGIIDNWKERCDMQGMEIAELKVENERLRSQLLTVRSDYKLELREENAALRQALTQNQPSIKEGMTMTVECFTGNCHHTRKEGE